MKRLFVKHFDKQFEDYKITVGIAKIGVLEFAELRKKHAETLTKVTSQDVEKINNALLSKNAEELSKVQNEVGQDVLIGFEEFSTDLMKKSICDIKINDEEYSIEEVFPQLQIAELNWISEKFAEVNKSLFDTKKKE